MHDFTPGDRADGGDADAEAEDDGDGGDAAAGGGPPSAAARRRATDSLLATLLAPGVSLGAAAPTQGEKPVEGYQASKGSGQGKQQQQQGQDVVDLQVLGRHDMGTHVHVFSHIRQTNYVQRVTAVFRGDLAELQRRTAAVAAAGADGGGVGSGIVESQAKAAEKASGQGEEPRRFAGKAAAKAEVEGVEGDDDMVEVGGGEEKEPSGEGGAGGKGPKSKEVKGRGKEGKGSKGKGRGKGVDVEGGEGQHGPAAVMWVTRQQMEGSGLALSSGVKKIFELAVGAAEGPAAKEGGKKAGAGVGGKQQHGEGKKRAAPGAGAGKKA